MKTRDVLPHPERPGRLWAPHSLLSSGYRGFFRWDYDGRGVKLTTHLHWLLRLRMSGAKSYTPITPTSTGCGAYSVKVKWSRYRPGVAQRVGRGIALLFRDRGTRRGWVVGSTPRPDFTPGKDRVPILQEAGWAPGPVWTGGKSRPHRDSIPDRPARSQSLYRLSYPAHYIYIYILIIHALCIVGWSKKLYTRCSTVRTKK